jgi:hypothetical protein
MSSVVGEGDGCCLGSGMRSSLSGSMPSSKLILVTENRRSFSSPRFQGWRATTYGPHYFIWKPTATSVDIYTVSYKQLMIYNHHQALAFALSPSPSVNFKLILFTQCRSSVGVGYPSPLKTCPKCPPHFVQVISVLSMPNELSTCRTTAPGIESKYAGHPQPDLNL